MKQGEKTKNYILDESDKLFYKNGYSSTSFSDIVVATGLSKGNITYHFKNKQLILEAIIDRRLDNIKTQFSNWEKKEKNPKDRLLLFFDMIISENQNIIDYGCPMGTLTAEFSKNEAKLYEITIPMFKQYRNWLKQQFELIGFLSDEADIKAMSLLGQVQGIATVTHAFKDKEFLHIEIKKIKKELLQGQV